MTIIKDGLKLLEHEAKPLLGGAGKEAKQLYRHSARDALGRFTRNYSGMNEIARYKGGHGVGVSASRLIDTEEPAAKHIRLFKQREQYAPSEVANRAAAAFRANHPDVRLPPRNLTSIPADYSRAEEITNIYLDPHAPSPFSPAVQRAYRGPGGLLDETADQMSYIKAQGVDVQYLTKEDIIERGLDPAGENPYSSAVAQAHDIDVNKRLMIASNVSWPEAYHPFLTNTLGGEYDQFRAVHDFFGHAAVGTGFSRHGEYQAWINHMSMFRSKEARAAASSELTAENSVLAVTGNPAPHRAVLLPQRLITAPVGPTQQEAALTSTRLEGSTAPSIEPLRRRHSSARDGLPTRTKALSRVNSLRKNTPGWAVI